MSDSQTILPITASTDGRSNMYSSRCSVVGQVMNYAACLWRQEVISNPKTRVPADWAACGEAAKCGRCAAVEMRREEVLQGRAIYFRSRTTGLTIKQEAMALHKAEMNAAQGVATSYVSAPAPSEKPRAPTQARTPPAVAVKRASSMLDVMGEGGGYADALNATASAPTATQKSPTVIVATPHVGPPPKVVSLPHVGPPAVIKPLGAAPVALPGESPLAMARRLAAQRQATSN